MQINRVIYLGKEGSAVIGTIQDAPLNVNDILMIVDKNGKGCYNQFEPQGAETKKGIFEKTIISRY